MNVLTNKIKNMQDEHKTFKRRPEKWLKSVSDETKIDTYRVSMAAKNNSIMRQVAYAMHVSPI